MDEREIQSKLNDLRRLSTESEVVEFKGAVNDNVSTSEIGKYFSALSNEANLAGADGAWLIFGIEDKTKNIVGTSYRDDKERLNGLKKQIADSTTNNICFTEIYCPRVSNRVLMFHIPPAPRGIPVAWKGHYYARDGESLVPLNIEKIERIRRQATGEDWSQGICVGASIEDLHPVAIMAARELLKKRYPDIAEDVDEWDNQTFLNKSKVAI